MGSTLPASWLSSVGKARDLSHCLVTGRGQSCLPYLQPCHGGLTAQKALTDVCMYGAHLKGKVLWVLLRSGKCITCLEATLGPTMFFSLSLLFPAGASLWGPLLETTSGDYPWGTIPGDHSWGDHPWGPLLGTTPGGTTLGTTPGGPPLPQFPLPSFISSTKPEADSTTFAVSKQGQEPHSLDRQALSRLQLT